MSNGICQYDTQVLPKSTGGGGGAKEQTEIINYDLACGIALSRLHLNVFEFYETTPIEFYYAIKDKKEWNEQKLETISRSIYESMRLQTVLIQNTNPYIKKKIKKVEELIRFKWDERKVINQQTLPEMKQALCAIAKKYGKKKGKK